MESFGHKKHTKKRAESLERTGKQCVPRASGDDCHARTSRFHPRLQLLDASKRLELVARSTRSVRMRDGVFQILLKFFVGALDQINDSSSSRESLPNACRAKSAATIRSSFPSSAISVSACHCQKRTDRSAPPSRMMSKMTCGSPSNNDAMIR